TRRLPLPSWFPRGLPPRWPGHDRPGRQASCEPIPGCCWHAHTTALLLIVCTYQDTATASPMPEECAGWAAVPIRCPSSASAAPGPLPRRYRRLQREIRSAEAWHPAWGRTLPTASRIPWLCSTTAHSD